MKDESNYPYDVFISYRWITPDQEWVREQLYPALIGAGLKVCLDVEDFVPGRDLILEMERAHLESRHVLCVITPEYLEEGRIVEFENLSARRRDPAGRNSFLIPLILREANIPERVQGLIPVWWTNPQNYTREWKKLLRALGAVTNVDIAPPPGTIQPTEETHRHDQVDDEPEDLEDVLGQVDSQLLEWADVLLNYAYYFDRDGRRSFFPIDIATDWINAYRTFLFTGDVSSSKDMLISYLPMNVDPDTGLQELDDNALSSVFDYLVIKGYLTRAKHIAFKERYEITDKGRFYFANKFLRSEAKRGKRVD